MKASLLRDVNPAVRAPVFDYTEKIQLCLVLNVYLHTSDESVHQTDAAL